MGVGKEWASQIRQAREQKEVAEQESVRVATVISNDAARLWDELQTSIEQIAKELSEELPEAKYLRADRLNNNNLTVQTTVFPIIKVQILRGPDGYLQSTVTEMKQGLGETRVRRSAPIGYTVNGNDEARFTYGEAPLTAQQLAEELMKPVASFFQELV